MAIAFVNHGEGQVLGGGGTSLAAAAINATAANLIVVGVRQDTDLTVPSSVTDTAGNTYVHVSAADSTMTNSTADVMTVWYAKNITGNATNVVTANWAGAHSYCSIMARQYSGLHLTAPLDATAFAGEDVANNFSSITSSTFTTAVADEVIVAFASTGASNEGFTAGSIGGTTATNLFGDAGAGAQQSAGEDRIVSSIQTGITAAMGWSTALGGEISVVTFKIASGAAARGLFRQPPMNGLGDGGSFFANPLSRHRQPRQQEWMRSDRIFVPRHVFEGRLLERTA